MHRVRYLETKDRHLCEQEQKGGAEIMGTKSRKYFVVGCDVL